MENKYIIEESHKYPGCFNIYLKTTGERVYYFAGQKNNIKLAEEWIRKNNIKLEIGQTIYYFDQNYRIYDKKISHGPIYSKHFRPLVIEKETDKEYILDFGTINKKSNKLKWAGTHKYYTEQGKNDKIFMHENQWKIAEKIKSVNIDKLKKIKEILDN